jgi:hypothetical protein
VDKPVKSLSPFCHWTPNSVCFSANNPTNGKRTFVRPANGKQAEEKSTKLPFSGTVFNVDVETCKIPQYFNQIYQTCDSLGGIDGLFCLPFPCLSVSRIFISFPLQKTENGNSFVPVGKRKILLAVSENVAVV